MSAITKFCILQTLGVGVGIKMSWAEKNLKINNQGGGTIIWDSRVITLNIRSIHSIPKNANLMPFRAPKPAISHLILFGLSPETFEKI